MTFAIINIICKITYSSSYLHSSRTDNLCAADLAKYTCAGRQERRQTRILLELISDLISGLALISDLTMETYQPPLQQECDPGRGCMELHIAEYKFGPRNKLWHIQYQNIELQDVEANNMLVRQSSPERLHTPGSLTTNATRHQARQEARPRPRDFGVIVKHGQERRVMAYQRRQWLQIRQSKLGYETTGSIFRQPPPPPPCSNKS